MRILITVSPDGLLRGFAADGHAGGRVRGTNIACAAVTTLLRTTGRLCTERAIVRDGGAGRPGQMRLTLATPAAADAGWLRGVTDFLLQGVRDLQKEFPQEIELRMERTEV